MKAYYIVQDLETHEFLYPSPDGDVGQTPYLKQAGRFEEYQDAIDAGQDMGVPFVVFNFYLPD